MMHAVSGYYLSFSTSVTGEYYAIGGINLECRLLVVVVTTNVGNIYFHNFTLNSITILVVFRTIY